MRNVLIFDDQEEAVLIMAKIILEMKFIPYPTVTEGVNIEFRELKELFIYYINDPSDDKIKNLQKYIDERNIHLFIIDIDLRGDDNDSSGKILAKNFLQVYYPKIPILFITQYPTKIVDDVLRKDSDDFLQKVTVGFTKMETYLATNLPVKLFTLLNR